MTITAYSPPEVSTEPAEVDSESELPTDSLSTGVAFMMTLAVAQRGVGFIRTALFCRLLPEQELGQWSLVFSFVMLSAPMTLMGITGSFGRYVEHYFQRGLIKEFLQRTGLVVAILTALVLCGMWATQDHVARLLFGSVAQKQLLLPACITLLTNITYNYFLEVAIALRRIKIGSLMELISSWVFAAVAVATLYFTDLGAFGVILGYAVGNLCGAAFACVNLLGIWQKLPSSGEVFSHTSLWRKLAPFALGLWVVNIVTNLFDLSDRYMIVHFSGLDPDSAQGMVGQYFSSLAVPLLMVGVSTTLAHLVMPYLSQDWELGKTRAVSERLNLSFKMLGLLLCIASAGVMLIAPLLFDVVFGGKYTTGLAVLPYTVAFCFWRAITTMGYNFLYCVERPRLMCISLVVSLVINVVLNAVLLPPLGLVGAAIATTISSVLNLVIILYASVRLGFRMSRGVWWVVMFPLALPFGAITTAISFAVLVLIAYRTTWVFSVNERNQVDQVLYDVITKIFPPRWVKSFSLQAPTA